MFRIWHFYQIELVNSFLIWFVCFSLFKSYKKKKKTTEGLFLILFETPILNFYILGRFFCIDFNQKQSRWDQTAQLHFPAQWNLIARSLQQMARVEAQRRTSRPTSPSWGQQKEYLPHLRHNRTRVESWEEKWQKSTEAIHSFTGPL